MCNSPTRERSKNGCQYNGRRIQKLRRRLIGCERAHKTSTSRGLENDLLMGDNPTVTVTADSKKRVVIPTAKPGDCFEIRPSVEGSILLTRMEPAEARPA